MVTNNLKTTCVVKSYTSEISIQNWIDNKKKEGYSLTFFHTQFDPLSRKVIYTAVMES